MMMVMIIIMIVIVMVTVIGMTIVFCNFHVLQISFSCYYLERDVKLHYLNGVISIELSYL